MSTSGLPLQPVRDNHDREIDAPSMGYYDGNGEHQDYDIIEAPEGLFKHYAQAGLVIIMLLALAITGFGLYVDHIYIPKRVTPPEMVEHLFTQCPGLPELPNNELGYADISIIGSISMGTGSDDTCIKYSAGYVSTEEHQYKIPIIYGAGKTVSKHVYWTEAGGSTYYYLEKPIEIKPGKTELKFKSTPRGSK